MNLAGDRMKFYKFGKLCLQVKMTSAKRAFTEKMAAVGTSSARSHGGDHEESKAQKEKLGHRRIDKQGEVLIPQYTHYQLHAFFSRNAEHLRILKKKLSILSRIFSYSMKKPSSHEIESSFLVGITHHACIQNTYSSGYRITISELFHSPTFILRNAMSVFQLSLASHYNSL